MAPGVLQSFFLIFTILQVCKNRISKCFEIQIHKSLLWDHFFSARTCRSHHGWEICGSLEYKRLDEEGSGCRRTHHHFHTPAGRVISHDDYDHNWYQAGRRCRCWMCYRLPMVRTGGSTNTLDKTRRRLETLSTCIAMVTIRHYHFENRGEHSSFRLWWWWWWVIKIATTYAAKALKHFFGQHLDSNLYTVP